MERIFQGQIHFFLSLGLWWLTGKPYGSTNKINFKLCEAMKVKPSCMGDHKMLEMPELWAICQRESHTGSRLSPRERKMDVIGSKSGGTESLKSFETQVPESDIRTTEFYTVGIWFCFGSGFFSPCSHSTLMEWLSKFCAIIYWKYVICFLIL